MRKTGICVKLFAIVLALFMVAPVQAISAPAGAVKIEINHKPSQEKYIPGFRIQLDTTIENDKGFLATRCYFKAKNDKVFTFVNMRNIKGNEYSAILPAPWVKSEFIEYLFVAVDMDKVVTRTQLFKVEEEETQEAGVWKDVGEVKEIRVDQVQEVVEEKEILRKQIREKYSSKRPPYQIDPQGVIVVSTELDKALSLNGFYDGINLFKVPAAARYGVLAEKLYTPEQIAEAGGSATVSRDTGAVSNGTIVVEAGGMSGGAIIGTGVVVAALVGGGVAIAGSSGDSDSDSSSAAVDVGAATDANFFGTYSLRDPSRSTNTWRGATTLAQGGAGSWEEWYSGQHSSGSLRWSWSQSSRRMVIDYLTGAVFSGTVTGNTYNFTLSGRWSSGASGTLIFTR